MPRVIIRRAFARNFKCFAEKEIKFSDPVTVISGMNATGKTTTYDLFLWVLFGSDSAGRTDKGVNSFSRPIGIDGKPIDNVEIEGIIELSVDGRNHVFRKVQKQKWTRVRGTADYTFKGNENIYEIDGVPKKESEYQEFIDGILDREHIQLLTNIYYFESMKPEEKMKLLLDVCGDVTDEDVLASDEKWEPIKLDVMELGVKDASTKAKSLKNELVKRQKDLPIRIDEASRGRVDIPDRDKLKADAQELDRQYKAIEKKIADITAEMDVSKYNIRKAEIINRKTIIQNELMAGYREVRNNLRNIYDERRTAAYDAKQKYLLLNQNSEMLTERVNRLQHDLDRWGAEYKTAKESEFDSKSTFCPTCGQTLPTGSVEKLKSDFLNRKKATMDNAVAEGKKVRTALDSAKAELAKIDLTGLKKKYDQAEKECADAKTAYESYQMPSSITNDEISALNVEEMEINEILSGMIDKQKELSKLKAERDRIFSAKDYAEDEYYASGVNLQKNAEVDARIEELTAEQREIGQSIALAEQKVILLEEFSIARSHLLSEKINSHFRIARFVLVDEYQSGGAKAACHIQYNGISDAGINTGHRIIVLLDIINTFQKHFDCQFPVFIDNAECLDSGNQPVMDSQLIMLKVTDDPVLTIS